MSSQIHAASVAFGSQNPDMKALVDAVDVVTAESPAPAVAYLAPSPPTISPPSAGATAGPFRKRKHGDPVAAAALDASTFAVVPNNSYAGHLASVPSPFLPDHGSPAYPTPTNAAAKAPVAVTSAAPSAGGKTKKPRTSKTSAAKASLASGAPDAAAANPARQKRLEQNRLAAIESRRRKKVMLEELQRSVAFYTKANASLKSQNEDLEGRILWAKCKVYQMEQEKQTKASRDDEKKSRPEEASKPEGRTRPESDAPSDKLRSDKVAVPTEVVAASATNKPPANVRVPAQLPTRPAAPAGRASRPIKTAPFSNIPMTQDGTEVELTEEQQAHFAATQALYKSMGFPPGAARAAAFTFCLTGRRSGTAFGGGDEDPLAMKKTNPTNALAKRVTAPDEPKTVKPEKSPKAVPPVPAPVSVPALPAIAAASPPERKIVEVAAAGSTTGARSMPVVPAPIPISMPEMPSKDSRKNEETDEGEDADASTSYIEALNKFAMQQAVAANAAAAAASAAIQAAKFHSDLMKKKHHQGKNSSLIQNCSSTNPSPGKSLSPSTSDTHGESRNSQSTSSPSPSSPTEATQGMSSMPCFSFPFQAFGFDSQMPFPQVPNNMMTYSSGAPCSWGFPSNRGFGSEETKE
ncbi:hypothetical protein ACHAXS_011425 [Conticribra weissflogii]